MLKIHCFQHVDFEGLGCIADWCEVNHHSVSYTRFYLNEEIPAISSFDWLIVMGGPMGIYDEQEFLWLKAEKQAIRKAIEAGKTVIGICLGSQLIADVLGAKVYPNKDKEIGWFDIQLTSEGKSQPIFTSFEPSSKVFHWHGDTFDIPENARHLAESKACKNQAFLFNGNVLGLQFHFEVTPESLQLMVQNGKQELRHAPFIQPETAILERASYIPDNNRRMYQILDYLAHKTNNL